VAKNKWHGPKPFTLAHIHRYAPDLPGVYTFWFGRYCVYVGQSKKQSIRKRLIDHWQGSHNPALSIWIKAKKDSLTVSWLPVERVAVIPVIEKRCIQRLQPLTNVLRYH
jgi:hypothetical protein